MKGFEPVQYMALWGARNLPLVKPITFHDPVKNEEFWRLLRIARAERQARFVGVDVGMEKAGHRQVKKFRYA